VVVGGSEQRVGSRLGVVQVDALHRQLGRWLLTTSIAAALRLGHVSLVDRAPPLPIAALGALVAAVHRQHHRLFVRPGIKPLVITPLHRRHLVGQHHAPAVAPVVARVARAQEGDELVARHLVGLGLRFRVSGLGYALGLCTAHDPVAPHRAIAVRVNGGHECGE
jgi:hypothetical protein